MELPKDWEAIAAEGLLTESVVERCYALTQKPRKELTDAEIDKLWPCGYYRPSGDYSAPRNLIDAYEAKQREPETVTFRAARSKHDGKIQMFDCEPELSYWEWLDHDGKAQTFVVKV